jgi:putative sigma-54 modulation protein
MISVEVRSKTDDMEPLIRQFAERRISFALDHLSNVRRIAISVEDVNGPKGGADKHCRIVAELAFTSLVLDETQPDWQSAVARAIHRLDRKATQELQRVNRSGFRRAHRSHFRSSTKAQIESEHDSNSKPNTQTD